MAVFDAELGSHQAVQLHSLSCAEAKRRAVLRAHRAETGKARRVGGCVDVPKMYRGASKPQTK